MSSAPVSSVARQTAGPACSFEIVDLLRLSGRELDPLLLEETVEWRNELDWDFGTAAEMVRRFVDNRALAGAAILDRGEVAGYGYAVIEGAKALIGDLYVRPPWRSTDAGTQLFRTILDGLEGIRGLRRIESQIMMIPAEAGRAMARETHVELCERMLMSATTSERADSRGEGSRFEVLPWRDAYEEATATLIAAAYRNHIDSTINDQYRDVPGARRFLFNIIRYPGCGVFAPGASFVVQDKVSGTVAGAVLATMVTNETGHIAQICVDPGMQSLGLGRMLLNAASAALARAGGKRMTLTVTASNRAVDLYRRAGFSEVRRFLAYVRDRE